MWVGAVTEKGGLPPMFLGTHAPKIDDKGRVILPAKFRDPLAEGLILTKGQERCIVVWTKQSFDDYASRLRQAPQTNERTRSFSRVFFSSAYSDQPDKQGRVTLPASLRDYAQIDRDVVVVGADTRIEIWNAGAWQDYLASHEQGFSEIDGEVVPQM